MQLENYWPNRFRGDFSDLWDAAGDRGRVRREGEREGL